MIYGLTHCEYSSSSKEATIPLHVITTPVASARYSDGIIIGSGLVCCNNNGGVDISSSPKGEKIHNSESVLTEDEFIWPQEIWMEVISLGVAILRRQLIHR